MPVIGIDLGGTKIAGAVFDFDGNIMKKHNVLLSGKTGKDVGQLILDTVQSLLKNEDGGSFPIHGVGVCVPGIANSKTNLVWAPNIPGWESYPLKAELEDYFNSQEVKINIESDRTCYIMGEVWKGAAIGCQNAIYISVGTGIGAGILIDGRILHGAGDIVGATGWMALQSPYKEAYESCGCFEYYASGRGILENTKGLLKSSPMYLGYLRGIAIDELNTPDIFDAYWKDDSIAQQVIKKAIEMWGMATANLVSLFNPEKIIFGGGVFGPAAELLDEIMKEAKKWAQPVSIKTVKTEISQLKGNAGLYGAAYLVMNQNP
jgi:glucokinase